MLIDKCIRTRYNCNICHSKKVECRGTKQNQNQSVITAKRSSLYLPLVSKIRKLRGVFTAPRNVLTAQGLGHWRGIVVLKDASIHNTIRKGLGGCSIPQKSLSWDRERNIWLCITGCVKIWANPQNVHLVGRHFQARKYSGLIRAESTKNIHAIG